MLKMIKRVLIQIRSLLTTCSNRRLYQILPARNHFANNDSFCPYLQFEMRLVSGFSSCLVTNKEMSIQHLTVGYDLEA